MSAHAIPAHPMVSPSFRDSFAGTVTIAFPTLDGEPAGAKEVAPGRFVFGVGTNWDVQAHDLHVRIDLTQPALLAQLFGPEGLVCRDSSVALSCEWTSQDSGRREIIPLPPLDAREVAGCGPLQFSLCFPKGSARGTIRLSVQLVLATPGRPAADEGHLARVRGTRLGHLCHPYELVLDGDGSLFPIREMRLGSDGPLWRLEVSWDDPAWDDFGPEVVALEVNCDHPSFVELKGASDAPYRTPLFRQSVSAWLTLFLWRLREATASAKGQSDGGSLWDAITNGVRTEFLSGSVADAAWLFISRGQLDTGSMEQLMESAQTWVDSAFRKS